MSQIVLTTDTELIRLIDSSIRKVLNERIDHGMSQDKDKILTVQEASEFLNLAKQTLYGFTSKNEIPFLKKGKKLYFRKSDLEEWLQEGKKKSRSEILKDLRK
jgi:excisionase family DNA binding protein